MAPCDSRVWFVEATDDDEFVGMAIGALDDTSKTAYLFGNRPSDAAIAAERQSQPASTRAAAAPAAGCRRAQQREHDRRAALAEDEEPHQAGPGSRDGRKSAGRLAADAYWHEWRRRLIEGARVTTEERGGREYVLRQLAPQFGAVSE
jgi:hypothetical protein